MPIIRKSEYLHYVQDLENRCNKLIAVAKGKSPNSDLYESHTLNPDDFERDFIEVSEHEINIAVSELRSAINSFKSIKKFSAKKLGRR
jgi:hypothetical protein